MILGTDKQICLTLKSESVHYDQHSGNGYDRLNLTKEENIIYHHLLGSLDQLKLPNTFLDCSGREGDTGLPSLVD